MKKELTINLDPPISGIPGVTHVKSVILISKDNTFEPDSLVINHELLQNTAGTEDILKDRIILDFPRSNTMYFCRTETFLGGDYVDDLGVTQTYDESIVSPVSKITLTGTSSTYQYSNTIIKTPNVRLITANRDNLKGYEFVSDEMKVYRGKGKHTATSWRLLHHNAVVWTRDEDPDNLTEIKLPITLDGNHSYTLECAHHSGDSMSEWGKHYFETDINQEQTFGLDFTKDLFGRNVIALNTNNFIEFKTRFTDYMSHSWKITQDGVVVLRDSTVVREDMEDVHTKNIMISGDHLTEGTYQMTIDAVFSGSKMRRVFDLHVVLPDTTLYDYIDKDLTLDLFEHDPIMIGTENRTIIDSRGGDEIDGKHSFSVIDGVLERFIRTGASYQLKTMQTRPEFLQAVGYESRVDIIWDKLIVQTVEELPNSTGGTDLFRRGYVYNYDKVNNCIFNMSDVVELDMGPIMEVRNTLNIVTGEYHQIKAVVLNPGLEPVVQTFALTPTSGIVQDEVELTGSYGSQSIPHIVSMDKRYYIIVGDGRVDLMHKKTGIFLPVTAIIDGMIDFSRWSGVFNSANGDVLLVGLDTRVAGNEILCYYKWDEDFMGFRLIRTFNVPTVTDIDLTTTTELNRPIVAITSNGYVGLGYKSTTLWLS